MEAVRAQEEHLRLASGERKQYNNCCKESKHDVQRFLGKVDFAHGREPCSYSGTMHYSYDCAQQLNYPLNPN